MKKSEKQSLDKLLYSMGEEDVGGYCTFISFPHISYLFIEIDKKSEKIYLVNTKSIIPICETYKLTEENLLTVYEKLTSQDWD